MRRAVLALAITLVAEITQARADMIAYSPTGTITSVQASRYSSLAVGDHITWTLQYNRFTPLGNGGSVGNFETIYYTSRPVISNVIDQSTGYHFYTPSALDLASKLLLYRSSYAPSTPSVFQDFDESSINRAFYSAGVSLYLNGSLPTLNLANLQIKNIPFLFGTPPPNGYSSEFLYNNTDSGGAYFLASVDSISGPFYGAPEPGALTMFLLGIAGLSARGIRHRFRFV